MKNKQDVAELSPSSDFLFLFRLSPNVRSRQNSNTFSPHPFCRAEGIIMGPCCSSPSHASQRKCNSSKHTVRHDEPSPIMTATAQLHCDQFVSLVSPVLPPLVPLATAERSLSLEMYPGSVPNSTRGGCPSITPSAAAMLATGPTGNYTLSIFNNDKDLDEDVASDDFIVPNLCLVEKR